MNNSAFEQALAKLNSAQREAVEAIEGPVMVVAGPGTGKTQILTLRIANIIKRTDTAPAQILALTFTESGVISMRRRLVELIGTRAYAVVINTFHGFCNDIIKRYPEDFPRIVGSRHLSEVEQVELLETLVLKLPLKILRPFGDPLLYVRHILGAINTLKREGVTVTEFLEILQTARVALDQTLDLKHTKGPHQGKIKGNYQKRYRELEKNDELALVYQAYEAELATWRLYDYSDMIMEVLQTLKTNASLLQILQEEHQYLLVDEHQDTNNAQNKVIELLANFHDEPNLFVVGDEKQAIFRFQGASLENFRYFQKLYPRAKLINLTENYRSSQAILDSAGSLLPGQGSLQARAGHADRPVKVLPFVEAEAELYFVATDVKQRIESGTKPSEIAVLYRNNGNAFPLAAMLEKTGVGFVIESDQDLLSQIDVRKLLIMLMAIERFGEAEPLAAFLHLDLFKLDPLSVYRAIRQAKAGKNDLPAGPLRQSYSEASRQDLIELIKQKEEFKSAYTKLAEWRRLASNDDLLKLVETIVRDSGLLEQILISPEAVDRFAAVRRFYDEVADLVAGNPVATLTSLTNYLETVRKHQLLIKRARLLAPDRVRLMTAHRAKGLEFAVVYIIGATVGHWGGKNNRELLKLVPEVYGLADEGRDTDDDDERRLFYVALTRAKQEVLITYSQVGRDGREQTESSFVGEIKSELKEVVDTSALAVAWSENKAIVFRPAPARSVGLNDQAFVREIFLAQGLSVSALNNYLACPWQYFYRNLIRLPERPSRPQLYGIAVHGALADFFNQALEREWSAELLLDLFESHLRKQPLSENDFNELLAKGREALSGWFIAGQGHFSRQVLTEFRIAGVLLSPEIRLTGVLDKIEFLADGSGVRVVDYKTKQPMSRAAILGETKTDDDGNYHRQLVFYKLLLDAYENGKYKMVTGEIDFIEPNQSGKYKSESFTITNEETEALAELIRRVGQEILALDFWDKHCDDKDCPYCALRDLMK